MADDDIGATLDRFVNRIVRTIPGCADAIITVRSEAGVETVRSSRELGFDPLGCGRRCVPARWSAGRRGHEEGTFESAIEKLALTAAAK